jgi:periplasmic copper chaperone A
LTIVRSIPMVRRRPSAAIGKKRMHLPARFLVTTALTIAATSALAQANNVSITRPWARATPGGAITGAAYMTITNSSERDDRLVSASSAIADKVQVHRMSIANGVMTMREVAGGLVIPAHGSVTLSPGGYHMMIIGLKHGLKKGDTVRVALKFQNGDAVDADVPVLPIGAPGPAASEAKPAADKPDDMGAMGGMNMK